MQKVNLAVAILAIAVTSAAAGGACGSKDYGITWTRLGRYWSGGFGSGTMEVVAYDAATSYAAVVESNPAVTVSVTVVSVVNPSNPTLVYKINMAALGVPNSASIKNGILAISADAPPPLSQQDPGTVYFYNLTTGVLVHQVSVGPMPDMIVFNGKGDKLYVAVEGEPFTQGDAASFSDPRIGANPDGGFGIVSFQRTGNTYSSSYKELSIQAYIDGLTDAQYLDLLSKGFRIDPRLTKSNAAKDVEPEYIALNYDYNTAYVTLQENNAIMRVDLKQEKIVAIWPMGLKDWGVYPTDLDDTGSGFAAIQRVLVPGAYARYQPDTIAFRRIQGKGYIFTANEGDSKEEKQRFSSLANRGSLVTAASALRYNIDPFFGIVGGYNPAVAPNLQGPYEKIIGYGGRSFSIFDADTGALVFESGSLIEEVIYNDAQAVECYGCDRDRNRFQARNDDSGPEPESVEVFSLEGRTYVSVGLERQGGIMLWDVTYPAAPTFVQYVKSRNFSLALDSSQKLYDAGSDSGPEGIKFVEAAHTASGKNLALVTNEVTGTLAVYEVTSCFPLARTPLIVCENRQVKASGPPAQRVNCVCYRDTNQAVVSRTEGWCKNQ